MDSWTSWHPSRIIATMENFPELQDRLPSLLDHASRAAKASATEILSGYRNPGLVIERKADGSVVTPHDRAAERQIRASLATERLAMTERLARESPVGTTDRPGRESPLGTQQAGVGICGEELGDDGANAPLRWLIDPIDG